jgi:hypothetical protein
MTQPSCSAVKTTPPAVTSAPERISMSVMALAATLWLTVSKAVIEP